MEDDDKKDSSDYCSKLGRIIRRELNPKWVGFNGVHPNKFATPLIHFPYQPISWIVFRFFLAFYLNLWLAITIWKWGTKPDYPRGSDSKAKFLVFSSNWAYIFTCLYFLFSAISTLVYHMDTAYRETSATVNTEQQKTTQCIECGGKDPCQEITLPWYMKLTWLFQILCYPAIFTTTSLRWFVDTGVPYQYATNPTDIHVHGIGLLFVIIDFVLIASPYRMQHVIYPMICGVIYYTFTGIYYLAGGTNEHHLRKEVDGDTYIYREKVDWGKYPKTTGVFLVINLLITIPFLHLCFYLLFKLKELFVEWYYYYKRLN